MKKNHLLLNFEYKTYDLIVVMNDQSFKLQAKKSLPLLELKIDFTKGKIKIQADRQFILQHNRQAGRRILKDLTKRVQIQMDILVSNIIDLDRIPHNGLFLPLEGIILDGSDLNAYKGMLVVKNERHNKLTINFWRLVFYIYDDLSEYDEIKFELPLYLDNEFEMN